MAVAKASGVRRALEKVITWAAAVTFLALFLIMITTVADVTMRHFFNSPIPGVLEFNELAQVVVVMLGMSWTQMQKAHVKVELVTSRLSQRTQAIIRIFVWVLVLALAAVLLVEGGIAGYESWKVGEYEVGLVRFPIWMARWLVPIGAFLLCLQLLMDIFDEVNSLFHWPPTPNAQGVDSGVRSED